MKISNIITKLLGRNEKINKRFTLSNKYLYLKMIFSLFNSLIMLSLIYLLLYFSQSAWQEFFNLTLDKQSVSLDFILLILIAFFLFILLPLLLFYYLFYLKISNEYLFTDKRIIIKNGWISTKAISVHYNRITDVGINQSIIDRILGIGALAVSTAGNDGYNITLSHIPKPYQLKKELYDLKEEYLNNIYKHQATNLTEDTGY